MARQTSAPEKAENSTEIAKRPYEDLARYLWTLAEMTQDDGDFAAEVMRDTVDRIATAETVDDIFAAAEEGSGRSLRDAEELLMKPIALDFENFVWLKSAEQYRKNGLGVFVVAPGMLDSGENVNVTTGAPTVVATLGRLYNMWQNDKLDSGFRVMFKSKQTSSGNNLLLCVKAV